MPRPEGEVPPEVAKEFNVFFEERFGIPFSFAVQLSELPNELGEHWKHALEYLASGQEEKPVVEGIDKG